MQTTAGVALTLPTVIAYTQLLPGEVAVAVVGTSAVVPAVRDVTGFAFPILVTFTVHSAGGRVARRALPMSRAVIGTRVDPGQILFIMFSRCSQNYLEIWRLVIYRWISPEENHFLCAELKDADTCYINN